MDVYPLFPRTAQELGLRKAMAESHDREYLFSAVESFLRSLANNSPVLLILDDLHVADDATLELFQFLSRKSTDFPLLIIATYRSEGEAISRHLSQALATLSRLGQAKRFSLEPLDSAAVSEIVASTLGGAPADSLLESVLSISEGNPLFVEETVRTMQENGSVELIDGIWRSVSQLESVPDAVSQLLNDRFAHLSPDGRTLLTLAAVIGPEPTYSFTTFCQRS